MSIATSFKKDLAYYLLGVIIPGVISFASIPYFKRLLGNEAYATYNLLITSLLIINTVSVAWIGLSIVRLSSRYSGNRAFLFRSWKFAVLIQIASSVISVSVLLLLSFPVLLSVLFGLALLLAGSYMTLVFISQSLFRSIETVIAESSRAIVLFFGGSLTLYYLPDTYKLEKLLLFHVLSYIFPTIYLIYRNKLKDVFTVKTNKNLFFGTVKMLYQYGFLLMVWYLVAYMLAYTDRYLLHAYIDKEKLALYVAQFDLINKSILMVALPVTTAFFPLIANAYEKGQTEVVKKFLKKVILTMFVIMIGINLAYYLFGYDLINLMLNFPDGDSSYKWSGLLVISGSIIWYIGTIVHKKCELKKDIVPMIKAIILAYSVLLIVDLLLLPISNITAAGIGFVMSTITYVIAVEFFSRKSRVVIL